MIDRPHEPRIAPGGTTPALPPARTPAHDTAVATADATIPSLDVRGWEVVLADGSLLGVVDGYLHESQARRARYFSVSSPDRAGYLFIPIGIGALDPAQRRLKLKKPRADRLRALPLVTAPLESAEALAPEVGRAVYAAVTGRRVSRVAWPNRYRDPVFDPTRLFGRARTETPAQTPPQTTARTPA